jgi:hypothetical protein
VESRRRLTTICLLATLTTLQSIWQPGTAAAAAPSTSTINTVEVPKQILRTGINLDSKTVSPNTLQLAQNLNLLPILSRMQELRTRVAQRTAGNTHRIAK